MKRAITYARVSGDDRKYATSGIESQQADCRKYAESNGYQVVAEVCETPEKHTSGAAWLPELERVLKLAATGAFDVLVVREIDRLARNRFKQLSVEIELEAHGVTVEYVLGQFEDTAEGRLLKGLMSEFAEYEREKIRERLDRGRVRSVKAGNVTIGGSYAPYGYDLVNVNGRRKLVINEGEAAVVRLIFELYVNRKYSLYGVRDYLDDRGTPKPAKGNNHKARGKASSATWSIGTINGILDNETYIGRWHYRKTKQVKDPRTGKVKSVKRPREEWLQIEVPAILDERLFNAAKTIRDRNKRVKGKQKNNFYLLGGMLTCGHCGNNVSGMTKFHKGIGYGYYKCNARHMPKKYGFKCECPQYRVVDVDRVVWEYVKAIYTSPETLQEAIASYQDMQAEEQAPLLQMVESTAARLKDTEAERGRLLAAYAAGVLTLDDLAVAKQDIDKRADDLTAALAHLKAELRPVVLQQEQIDRIQQDAANIRRGIELADNDPGTQRRILEQLQVTGRLLQIDGKRWVEVDSILGPASFAVEVDQGGNPGATNLPAEYTTTSSTVRKSGR